MTFAGAAAGSIGLGSMFFNPATITQHSGLVSENNVAFIIGNARTRNATATTGGGFPLPGSSNSGNIASGPLGDIAPVPASYKSYQLNEQIWLGFQMNSPYGLETESGAYVGGPHGFKSRVTTIIGTPTIGIKLSEKLSIAGGVQVSYIDGRLTTAFPNTRATLTELEGSDWGVGFVGGILLDIGENTTFGAGFRSEIEHTLSGSFSSAVPFPFTTQAKADVTLPAQAHVSLSHQLTEQFKVAGSVEWTDWSTLQALVIRPGMGPNITQTFDWRDGWFFSLGGEFAFSEALTLRAGAAYEITPVRDAHRGPRVPDNDRIWVSAGATYKWSEWLTLHGSYTHIFVDDASINLPETPALPFSLNATFEQSVNIVSVGATMHW